MENIKVKSLGPIKEADINFGDLTFFVGPQASGKSILLQLIKLLMDRGEIERMLKNYGFVWSQDSRNNLELFFGEGMATLWTKRTGVLFDGINYAENFLSSTQGYPQQQRNFEELLYIPAQRVLCLSNGWPRFFNDFDESAPFVLREFSELLRLYLESTGASDRDFWHFGAAADNIYLGGRIMIERHKRKRLTLELDGVNLPFMTWSSGQKEFFPLAMSFDILAQFPPRALSQVNYIIVEEPEMGLHPEAIKSVILQIVGLIKRGYKLIVSTHSPVLLEFAWAFNILKQEKASPQNFDELFDLNKVNGSTFFTDELINKTINTYYFSRADDGVVVKDISSLDAGNEDLAVADWGGLSSFASKAGDIVSRIVASNA